MEEEKENNDEQEELEPEEQEDLYFKDFLQARKFDVSLDPQKNDDVEDIPLPQTWRRISHKPRIEHAWRIENLVPGEGFTILASVSGEKKTWVAMEMARCIVGGINFLGDERFKTEGCNVLYVNCENPESEIQRRGKQLQFPESGEHELYFLNSDALNLNDEEVAGWFLSYIEYFDIGVVFIDTFRAVAGALKEEKAEEIRQFFNKFVSLKNKGVTIVWLDHFRKPSNLDGKVPKKEHLLGSQDKAASVETLLMIRSENGSDTIDCYQRKNRLAVEIKPFQIVMADHVDEAGKKTTLLTYGGEIDEKEDKKEMAKELIIEILENGEKTSKELIELIKKQVGAKNTRAALKELVQDSLLDMTKRGRENLYFLQQEAENTPKTPFIEEDASFL